MPFQEMTDNRRHYKRVKPKQLATRVRAGTELHIGLGIENISMGGMFVRCNTPVKVGRTVTLELLRPGASQPLSITGRVTTLVTMAAAQQGGTSAGMGIAFDPLPPHLEQRLEGLIGAIDPAAVKEVPPPPPLPPRAVTGAAPAYGEDPAPRLTKEIEALRSELKDRNRKIEELLAENKILWQKIRQLGG